MTHWKVDSSGISELSGMFYITILVQEMFCTWRKRLIGSRPMPGVLWGRRRRRPNHCLFVSSAICLAKGTLTSHNCVTHTKTGGSNDPLETSTLVIDFNYAERLDIKQDSVKTDRTVSCVNVYLERNTYM